MVNGCLRDTLKIAEESEFPLNPENIPALLRVSYELNHGGKPIQPEVNANDLSQVIMALVSISEVKPGQSGDNTIICPVIGNMHCPEEGRCQNIG